MFVFFLVGFCALFIKPVNIEKYKSNFKIGSHCTIHTFKNYFVTVFSVISFQFLAINDIQTHPLWKFLTWKVQKINHWNRIMKKIGLFFFFFGKKTFIQQPNKEDTYKASSSITSLSTGGAEQKSK